MQSNQNQFSFRRLAARFVSCLREDSGSAMTEYLLVSGVLIPLACYLFHPDNGFYHAVRDQYNVTKILLLFPGP